jgi:hypothetical protein
MDSRAVAVVKGRVVVAAVVALASLVTAPRSAQGHPLHTTLTELSVGTNGDVEIRLRAFVDDFSAAVSGSSETPRPPFRTPTDSATARYLASRLLLHDTAGRNASLTLTTVRREGDVVWVTLRASGVRTLVGTRLTNTVLFERFADQVNIVQASVAGRRRTLLFTPRDGRAPKMVAA